MVLMGMKNTIRVNRTGQRDGISELFISLLPFSLSLCLRAIPYTVIIK